MAKSILYIKYVRMYTTFMYIYIYIYIYIYCRSTYHILGRAVIFGSRLYIVSGETDLSYRSLLLVRCFIHAGLGFHGTDGSPALTQHGEIYEILKTHVSVFMKVV